MESKAMKEIRKFKRVLVANRGEIAIRIFRACQELGIRTVAIYSEEDKNTLFRTKADESYQIGKGKAPVAAYLGIDEIIDLAKAKGVDAIHPGYGFLSENVEFAKACEAAGIEFIGPTHEMMDRLGDKIKSKIVADEVGVPTIPGVEAAIKTEEEAIEFAEQCGYPVMLKAAAGGGGRGMRIVRDREDIVQEYRTARSGEIRKETWCTSTSATAPFREDTRRWWSSLRLSASQKSRDRQSAPTLLKSQEPWTTEAPERWNSFWTKRAITIS